MELRDIAADAAKHLMKYGTHAPTVLVAFTDIPLPARFPLRTFPGTAEGRQHALFLHGKEVAEHYQTRRIQRVWFITEGWMSVRTDNTQAYLPPSRDPKRLEVLLTLELDATSQEQHIVIQQIQRNRRKKVKSLTPLPDLSPTDIPLGTLVLSFLAGFAERSGGYGNLAHRMLKEKDSMDHVLDDHDPS